MDEVPQSIFEKRGLEDIADRTYEDGGRVGGRGVHLSPQIRKEYTFRHRTPAESGQENLTSGKE